MNQFREKHYGLLAAKVIKGLESRNMEGFYCATKAQALEKAMEIIPQGAKVAWGGSVTLDEVGLKDAIMYGDFQLIDRGAAKTPEETRKAELDSYAADYYLCSSNAISEDGELVNIDGNANRVSCIAYGPEHVVLVVGMNKVARDLDAAIARARYEAAPINNMRFHLNNPCHINGACANCKSADTICCQFLITRYSRHKGRIKVILVGEQLGF